MRRIGTLRKDQERKSGQQGSRDRREVEGEGDELDEDPVERLVRVGMPVEGEVDRSTISRKERRSQRDGREGRRRRGN